MQLSGYTEVTVCTGEECVMEVGGSWSTEEAYAQGCHRTEAGQKHTLDVKGLN